MTEGAVSGMIGRLMKLGYVDRERDEKDGRAWKLVLSESGHRVLDVCRPQLNDLNAIFDKTLTEEETRVLGDMLRRLSVAFER